MTSDQNNFRWARAIICFYLLIFHPSFQDVQLVASQFKAIGIFNYLLAPIDAELFSTIEKVWRVSLAAAGLGLFSPFFTGVALLSGTYVLGYVHNFQYFVHGTSVIYMMLWVLFLAELGFKGSRQPFINLARVLIVLAYFIAGVQKLRGSGIAWAWSENLAMYIFENRATPAAKYLLAQDPFWVRVLASGALVGELLSPLALLGGYWVIPFLLFWTGLHVGTDVIFDHHASFFSQIACLAFFVNWDRITPARKEWLTAKFRLPPGMAGRKR